MAQRTWVLASLAAACALALGACSKQADSNPTAPGNPGTGNATVTTTPSAPDGPAGGPSGIAGSAAHTGSSGGDVLPGVTGKGTDDVAGRSQPATPGGGLNGGLNAGAAAATPGGAASGAMGNNAAVPNGSSNSTPGSAVGQR